MKTFSLQTATSHRNSYHKEPLSNHPKSGKIYFQSDLHVHRGLSSINTYNIPSALYFAVLYTICINCCSVIEPCCICEVNYHTKFILKQTRKNCMMSSGFHEKTAQAVSISLFWEDINSWFQKISCKISKKQLILDKDNIVKVR